ncbi:uncharacterized protein MYCGRDRAFT_72330 [Zymoseptoria tritici IPO323]|uniref:Uncharacterized protein n=1 Tax=Zymoseptoria tritici (strain CBS 115943 / IPO323) TaxID=336722 RepID=F9XAZ8_ZYMTI|nr:uncharacterized protein MYCGRDRAFT_72330 [Zymoseptoria tritici IPO323]EGP87224.1 hypothetical protein MYCGRDRAFT_72330 [Zymoseptoria tritici IPO323]
MALLHHRPNLEDIRYAYDSSDHDSERSFQRSQFGSDKSYTTALTQYSSIASKRPARIHYNTFVEDERTQESVPRYFADQPTWASPRASVETYTSSLMSEEEDNIHDELPEFEVPEYSTEPYAADAAVAATPADFSELFPSHRRLIVRHDDSTLDGNMNLRVDTDVTMHGGRKCDMTLFHLRMHDLRNREFSLRRYCRDSGREVCHTARKLQSSPQEKRPGLQRSLSNALSSMRFSKSYDRKVPTLANLKRNDSGYGSLGGSVRSSMDMSSEIAFGATTASTQPPDPNTVKLEFSNYAQVAVTCSSGKGGKEYLFEYWGKKYAWRRVVRKDNLGRSVFFHLIKTGSEAVLAYIIPSPLTPAQVEEEHSKGGWIPSCSMWLADEPLVRGEKDVADVVIASGLIALVDNCIKERFHSKSSKQIVIPKLQLGLEYVGPKRLINEMFKRGVSGSHSRQSSFSRSRGRPVSSGGGATEHAPKSAVTAVREMSNDC